MDILPETHPPQLVKGLTGVRPGLQPGPAPWPSLKPISLGARDKASLLSQWD